MTAFPFVFIDLGGWKTIFSHVKRKQKQPVDVPGVSGRRVLATMGKGHHDLAFFFSSWRRISNVPGHAETRRKNREAEFQDDLPTSLSPVQPASTTVVFSAGSSRYRARRFIVSVIRAWQLHAPSFVADPKLTPTNGLARTAHSVDLGPLFSRRS